MKKIAFLLIVLILSACDPQTGKPQDQIGEHKIAVGVSTEAEVRMIYGKPDDIWEEENGARMLMFPKGPEGPRTFAIKIGSDGKVASIENVLRPVNFDKIKAGMDQEAIRRLIGNPGKKETFQLKNEEVWTYRYLADKNNTRMFSVHFDKASGNVTVTSSADDPKTVGN
jgi:SmpA / OmlA family